MGVSPKSSVMISKLRFSMSIGLIISSMVISPFLLSLAPLKGELARVSESEGFWLFEAKSLRWKRKYSPRYAQPQYFAYGVAWPQAKP